MRHRNLGGYSSFWNFHTILPDRRGCSHSNSRMVSMLLAIVVFGSSVGQRILNKPTASRNYICCLFS